MSRSTFLTTSSSFEASETAQLPTAQNTNADHKNTLRFHHRLMPTISSSSRSHETIPVVVVQSSSTTTDSTTTKTTTTNTTQHKSVVRVNPKLNRNLRGKRRSTGIRPDEVILANAINDAHFNDDNEEEDSQTTCNQFITISGNTEPSESFEHSRMSPPKPVFTVSRLQPTFDENSRHSFEKLSITRADPFVMTSSSPSTSSTMYANTTTKMFRPEQFILRRQSSEDDPAAGAAKRRQLEERVRALESLVFEKDAMILDLQRKLDKTTRDLSEAEQQIYMLQRDKLTLVKSLASIQDTKSSLGAGPADLSTSSSSIRTGFITRN